MAESCAPKAYASSPCMAHELDPVDPDPPEQVADVMRWRHARRTELRRARAALGVAARQTPEHALSGHLRALIETRFDGARGRVLSACWPIKGELDLRPLMASLHRAGVALALPVVDVKLAPWQPLVTLALLLAACLILGLAVARPNPFSFGGVRNARFEPAKPGLLR